MKGKIATTILGLTLLTTNAAMAAALYSQSTDNGCGYASQNDTTSGGYGNFATVYDDFTLGSASAVTSVNWIGSIFEGPIEPVTGFTINFLSDVNGQPGTVLASENIVGDAGQTSLGNDQSGDAEFSYRATLPTAFSATGGTTYYLSIVADLAFEPEWGWETSGVGDDGAYQNFFGGEYSLAPYGGGNMAFTLDGSVLDTGVDPPAPSIPDGGSTLLLLGLACLGLTLARGKVRSFMPALVQGGRAVGPPISRAPSAGLIGV